MQKHWNSGNTGQQANSAGSADTGTDLAALGEPRTIGSQPRYTDAEVMQEAAAVFAEEPDDLAGDVLKAASAAIAKLDALINKAVAAGVLPREDTPRTMAPPAKPSRRVPASPRRIQQIMQAAQHSGLTPTGVTHHPDGRTTVHFGAVEAEVPTQFKPRRGVKVPPR